MYWWVTGRYNLVVKVWTLLSYTDLNCFPSVYRDGEGGWDWSSVLHRTVQEETSAQLGSVWKLLLLGGRWRTVAGSTEPTGSEEIPLKSCAASVGCLPWAAAASRYLLKLVTRLFIIMITEVSLVCIVGQTCFQMNCKILNSLIFLDRHGIFAVLLSCLVIQVLLPVWLLHVTFASWLKETQLDSPAAVKNLKYFCLMGNANVSYICLLQMSYSNFH